MMHLRKKIQEICSLPSIDEGTGALHTPVYRTTTFRFSEQLFEDFQGHFGREQWIYSRYSNPTIRSLERKLASIEFAEDAVVCASGMGAISSTLLALYQPHCTWFVSRELYGVTYTLFKQDFQKLGVNLEWFDASDVHTLYELGKSTSPDLIYFESLSNPLTKAADIPSIVKFGKTVGAITIVDNTFASPWNCCPIELGVDLVIESGSKYLNGHSDVICGVVVGKQSLTTRIWQQMTRLGSHLSIDAASFWERGLRTFPLRMEQCNSTAYQLSQWLRTIPDVEEVFYPQTDVGLPEWLMGGGGLLAFRVKGKNSRARALLDHLQIITPATSLGGVESLISLPYNTSHVSYSEVELSTLGILPGTVRLSVGMEPFDLLQQDLQQALEATRDVH